MRPLLTIRMVAEALQKHDNTIRRWVEDGTLPAFKIPGSVFITQHDLHKLIRQGRAHIAAVRTR